MDNQYTFKYTTKYTTMRITIIATTVIAGFAMLLSSCEPTKKNDSTEVAQDINKATMEDKNDVKNADFVVNTIAANFAEINLAKLAISRTKDAEIKNLATKVVAEHTQVLAGMQSYASRNSITVPTGETDEAKKELNKLAGKEATEFDKDWCSLTQENHEEVIKSFESRLDKTEDLDLKNWIASTLPVLRDHNELLKTHHANMK